MVGLFYSLWFLRIRQSQSDKTVLALVRSPRAWHWQEENGGRTLIEGDESSSYCFGHVTHYCNDIHAFAQNCLFAAESFCFCCYFKVPSNLRAFIALFRIFPQTVKISPPPAPLCTAPATPSHTPTHTTHYFVDAINLHLRQSLEVERVPKYRSN